MIFLTTTAATIPRLLRQVREQASWIEGVEVRADLLEPAELSGVATLAGAVRDCSPGIRILGTIRREADGGRWTGEESQRRTLLDRMSRGGFDLIDLESDLPIVDAERSGATIVRSLHDLDGTPANLARLARSLPRNPGEIAKVAVSPRSTAELVAIFRAADRLYDLPHVVLGMGPFGVPSRILTRRLGNVLTFASAPGESAAPGHLTPQTLSELYRLGSHGDATRCFAVVGNPIAHSRSPAYHNGRFAEEGIDAVYVPVLVDDVTSLFELAEVLPLSGFSVTIPHKRGVLARLSLMGDDVRVAQACNTVLRTPDGWRGVNTDVRGFLAPLDEVLDAPDEGGHASLRGMSVLLLGAGGSARAVGYALLSRGATVSIWNRTTAHARALATDLARLGLDGTVNVFEQGGHGVRASAPGIDILVNTTSVGMNGEGDPVPWYDFRGDEVVYDIVYTPPQTPLILRAAYAGCRVVTGDRMFAAQAAAQYELYRSLATADAPDV